MTVTAITTACHRPEAWLLAEKYMDRQTVKPSQWLVLDDDTTPTKCTLGQDYHYWPECQGRGSLVKKLRRALKDGLIKGDAVVFVENDDWYSPEYIAWCIAGLSRYALFGEGRALYYTVRERFWFEHVNLSHASLCSTAIRKDGFPWLAKQCAVSDEPFLDVRLWNRAPIAHRVEDPYSKPSRKRFTVGIKAMPGRSGYGGGHRGRDKSAVDDPSLAKLRALIGVDADAYAEFYAPSTVAPGSERNSFTVTQGMNARQWSEQHRANRTRNNPNA